MSDTPKRRFWQIHLSTAIVLVFAASLLLCMTLRSRTVVWDSWHNGTSNEYKIYGWPFEFYTEYRVEKLPDETRFVLEERGVNIYYAAILKTLLLAISTLAGVGFLTEFLIRRREARKP